MPFIVPSLKHFRDSEEIIHVQSILLVEQFKPNVAEDSPPGRKMINRWQWMLSFNICHSRKHMCCISHSQWITEGLIAHGNGVHYKMKTTYLSSSRRELYLDAEGFKASHFAITTRHPPWKKVGWSGNLEGLFPKIFHKLLKKLCLFLRGGRPILKSFKDKWSAIFYSTNELSFSKNKAFAERKKVKILNKLSGKDNLVLFTSLKHK